MVVKILQHTEYPSYTMTIVADIGSFVNDIAKQAVHRTTFT